MEGMRASEQVEKRAHADRGYVKPMSVECFPSQPLASEECETEGDSHRQPWEPPLAIGSNPGDGVYGRQQHVTRQVASCHFNRATGE
jgi:hypothetical protein